MPAEKMLLKEEETLESLLPRLAEIKTWQKDINAAKGNKPKVAELRKSFRAIFGVSFGQKLVADLNRLEKGETADQIKNNNEKEKEPLQPLKTVLKKSKELQAEVAEQQLIERALAKDVLSPELTEGALHIDKQKKAIIKETITSAEVIVSKTVRDNVKEENKKVATPKPKVKKAQEVKKNELVMADAGKGGDDEGALSDEILATREAVLSDIDAGYEAEKAAHAAEEAEKEANWDEQDEEALRKEILGTRDAVLADIDAGYEAEMRAHNLGLKEKISQADSFDSLFNIIKESGGIQGSKEFFSPEMLSNVLASIRSGEASLSAATSALGFRETVERILLSENQIMESEVLKCKSLEDFISLLNKFPELAVLGGDIKSTNEYLSYFSGEVEFTEKLYMDDNFRNKEQLKGALNFITRRHGLRDGVAQYIIKKNGFHFKDDPAKKNREEVNDSANSNLENPNGLKEGKSENQERDKKIIPEALEYFYSLGLDNKDLLSIPGLTELNGVSQLLIAKSLKSVALEKANRNVVKQRADASAAAKGFWGKLGTGIANTFTAGRKKKAAILEQTHGGLAEHKVELTRLVDWAQSFDLKEVEVEEGKFRADFTGHIDLENLNEEQAALVKEMNENANWLASCAKEYRLFTYAPESKGSKAHQEYYRAKQAYDDSRKQISALLSNDLSWSEASVLRAINKMDANVNMVQFMSANPDLEKDWQDMLKNKSILAKAFAKDNWKFLASGYAGRMALGSVLGFVAIPAVAMAVGAWRGRDRGRQALRGADKDLDKKDLPGDSPLLAERKAVLKSIQELVPAEYSLNREEWLNNIADSEQKFLYLNLIAKFNNLDERWRKEEEKKQGIHDRYNKKEYKAGKNVERKVLSAETLMSKLQDLIDKVQQAEGEKRRELLFQLSRRVDFSKDLADRGLVNFGSMEERSVRMLDFYQLLSQGQILQLDKTAYFASVSERELDSIYQDNNIKELSELNERAEDLLNSLEYFAEMQLDKNRHSFMKKKIVQGAIAGGIFAASGALLRELSGSWIEDKAAAGFRFISENIKFGGAAAAGIENHISSDTSSLTGQSAVEAAVVHSNVDTSSLNGAFPNTGVIENSDVNFAAESEIEPVLETGPNETVISSWSDQISNEGLKAGQYDSVWRSTSEIFKSHASELGYKGDLNDTAALHHWAELQTNRTLADSGDITNKVFEGNQVILEKSGDGFVVKVEAGSGAQPGHLSEVQIETSTGAEAVVGQEPAVVAGNAPEIQPDPFVASNNLETIGANKEIWADKAGARFGLSSEQVSYADENVIKADIDGHDVFIDTKNNTFLFFDDNANEVSGLLFDDNGHLINNAEEFLRTKFFSGDVSTATGVLDHLSDNSVGQDVPSSSLESEDSISSQQQTGDPQSLNQPDNSVSQGRVNGDTPPDIINQFDDIVDNHARETAGGSIKEALETIAARTKTPADKVLLEYIEENHISPDVSLNDLLSSDTGLLMSMNSPENSVLTELYDLRHASSGQAQSEMLYKYLHAALSEDLKDAGKLANFDKLASLNAFRVGSSLDGKVDAFVMQVGDNVWKVNFSAKGMSEVVKFVKQML